MNKLKNNTRIVLFGILLASQPTFAVSLIDSVTQTLKTNPEVQEVISSRFAADHTIDQAKSGYFPKVDLTAGIGREWSNNISTQPGSEDYTRRELGIVIKQMIYDGYSTKSKVERSQSLVEASAYQVASTSEQIAFGVVSAFLNVLRYEELLTITQNNLDSHRSIFKQIQSRSAKGVDNEVNSEQAKGRLALSHANLLATQGNAIDTRTTYQRVTGYLAEGLDKPGNKCCVGLPNTLHKALEMALKNHPSLRSSVANYEASMSSIQTAEALMRPQVYLEISSGMNRDVDGVKSENEDVLAMIRLRHNVYNGGADEARISEEEHLSDGQKEVVIRTKQGVEEEVRLAWNELNTAALNLPHLKAHAEASKKSHAAYLQQFKIGRRTLLDLLDTENEKFVAQSDYINGQYKERIACYRLLASMGVLVDTLGLSADESTKVAEN